MNTRFTDERLLQITKFGVVIYLLLFQSWRVFADYPAGVLSEQYIPVGIFHLLPGPLSVGILDAVFYLWPVFLIAALIPRVSKVGLYGSFIFGCYVLGYAYNYGRVFHGTSLALQMLLVLAIGLPGSKTLGAARDFQIRWTLWIAQLVICLCYFASGISKVMRAGTPWALSENLAIILHTQPRTTVVQEFLLGLPSIYLQALAAFVFIFEITSLLPFFFGRLRPFYLVAWASFHVGVALTLGGHVTFLSHLFLFPVFCGSVISCRIPSSLRSETN